MKYKLAKFSEYHGHQMILDQNDNYVATVQVYQTPRNMGLYDEGRRLDNAELIVKALNKYYSNED